MDKRVNDILLRNVAILSKHSAEEDGTDAPAYNLQGQRVQPVQKGLYIVNGKKTVMRCFSTLSYVGHFYCEFRG
jgi:hypothetical protein